ncbi:mRNA decapping complex subunit [Schizosaccharomyces japonicus yFS275]|uniref:U6 snRNA-associated Sm-like protein LSm1 n=1 Tax=Schizosaccharomyces japonicus (strain yFS275 / FY16936) TaxID=402676 RepID=B6K804_SCHJY|nr:mRNA decapping complex subunit [Schizosaccharomyces japonicus yFS275]EEB09658.2 mRNA decapping complex subunit [Schizosaccharomyces japonicus yFS275]
MASWPKNQLEMSQTGQMIPFTTSGSLVDYVDRKVIVILRDGKKLIGILRSFDQFANLMLQCTIERLYEDGMYGDIERGVYIVRGENVVLLGEIDLEREFEVERPFKPVLPEQLYPIVKARKEEKKKQIKARNKVLHSLGFSSDFVNDDLY